MTGSSQNLLICLISPFMISSKYFFFLLFDLDERRLYQTKETTRKAKFRITIKLKNNWLNTRLIFGKFIKCLGRKPFGEKFIKWVIRKIIVIKLVIRKVINVYAQCPAVPNSCQVCISVKYSISLLYHRYLRRTARSQPFYFRGFCCFRPNM